VLDLVSSSESTEVGTAALRRLRHANHPEMFLEFPANAVHFGSSRGKRSAAPIRNRANQRRRRFELTLLCVMRRTESPSGSTRETLVK
jgi:hypothetical protein